MTCIFCSSLCNQQMMDFVGSLWPKTTNLSKTAISPGEPSPKPRKPAAVGFGKPEFNEQKLKRHEGGSMKKDISERWTQETDGKCFC